MPKNVVPAVKINGDSCMIWGCFAASGTGTLCNVDEMMKSPLVLQQNLKPLARRLKPGNNWEFSQDNDPMRTHRSRSWNGKNRLFPGLSKSLTSTIWKIYRLSLIKATNSAMRGVKYPARTMPHAR